MRKLCATVTFAVLLICHALVAQSDAPVSAPMPAPASMTPVSTLAWKPCWEDDARGESGPVGPVFGGSADGPRHQPHGLRGHDRQRADRRPVQYLDGKANQCLPAHRRRKIPPQDSDRFRTGCHSRFPHHFSGSAGSGIDLGSARWWSRRPGSRRAKPRQPGFAGRFLPWSTLPAMPAGAASRKAPEKIHFSVRRWRLPTFAAIRERAWMRRTASPPAPSISSDTEQPRAAATTTPLRSPSTRLRADLSPAFSRSRGCRGGHHHVCLQLAQWSAGIRQSVHPAPDPARGMGISRRRRQ